MTRRRGFILCLAISLVLVSSVLIFAQEGAADEAATPETITPESMSSPAQTDMVWVWAEVISVDAKNKTILVKYIDYETDGEMELTVSTDDKTTYENLKSFDEIKPGDTLSIDYAIVKEKDISKNIAKNISLEKLDPESVSLQENSAKDVPDITPQD